MNSDMVLIIIQINLHLTGKKRLRKLECMNVTKITLLDIKESDYCNELVIKVKVYYEDITAVVHNGGKIRCKKLTVLD